MKKFFKNIFVYSIVLSMIITIVFRYMNGSFILELKNPIHPVFIKKLEFFSDFIKNNESINLILGSSHIEEIIIPDSIGNKWYSFSNSSQNIYESYKFIEYFKDSIKIDTLLISLNPIDFPYSYTKNRIFGRPALNGSFTIFGEDSITTSSNKERVYRNLERMKRKYFGSLISPLLFFRKHNKIINNKIRIYYPNAQGFSGKVDDPEIDLDITYKERPWTFTNHNDYYYNLKSPPNFTYFDLFNDLVDSLSIYTIYLITPKSKYYLKNVESGNYDTIWNDVLLNLAKRDVVLWDYEAMNTDTFNFHWYIDETHSSYKGAKTFTKIIKKRLNE